jgi:hypothetical protein
MEKYIKSGNTLFFVVDVSRTVRDMEPLQNVNAFIKSFYNMLDTFLII